MFERYGANHRALLSAPAPFPEQSQTVYAHFRLFTALLCGLAASKYSGNEEIQLPSHRLRQLEPVVWPPLQ
jgi:hypothetical protein